METISIPQQKIPKETKSDRWEPYIDNGGTTLAFTGKDYCILASDTRLSDSYTLIARNAHKAVKLTDKIVLSTGGMYADCITLHKRMINAVDRYQYRNGHDITIHACAQLLSNVLYSRRFFPIYAFCILGGIDDSTGEGVAFSYDAIGSFKKVNLASEGSAGSLIEPLLDSVILQHHRLPDFKVRDIPLQDALDIAHQALVAAAERDIHTGDFAEIFIVTRGGVEKQVRTLKFD